MRLSSRDHNGYGRNCDGWSWTQDVGPGGTVRGGAGDAAGGERLSEFDERGGDERGAGGRRHERRDRRRERVDLGERWFWRRCVLVLVLGPRGAERHRG